jgi:hypothetical protein
MTVPVPYKPHTAGSGFLKYEPATNILSDGLIVDASTLTNN